MRDKGRKCTAENKGPYGTSRLESAGLEWKENGVINQRCFLYGGLNGLSTCGAAEYARKSMTSAATAQHCAPSSPE